MTSRRQENHETDPELDKILTKSFEDLRKRITNLMARREKKLLKDALGPKKTQKRERGADRGDREPRAEKPRAKKEVHRSRSTSEESS